MAVGKRYAFTLVELLIVLAIVAILAMVAAPRMIETKTLSKLAQVHQDQRLLQYALDSYFQDYGGYPRDQKADGFPEDRNERKDGFSQLMWIEKYIDSHFVDPFKAQYSKIFPIVYEGGSGSDEVTDRRCSKSGSREDIYKNSSRRKWTSPSCIHAYIVISCGPDRGNYLYQYEQFKFPYSNRLHSYSPTNGTESAGDIFRMTGQYRRGNVTLDGIPLSSMKQYDKKGGIHQ